MEEQKKQDVASHSLESEFVTYEQALALNELGFRGKCFRYWVGEIHEKSIVFALDSEKLNDDELLAPLKQQVFRWFRDNHNIIGIIEGGYTDGKNVFSHVIWRESDDDWTDDIYDTYEEAENACIDKLLELAKQHDI